MTAGRAMPPQEATTLPQLVRAAAAAYGNAPAIRLVDEGAGDGGLSFAELDARSALLARALLARGAGKGTRIGFIHGNDPRFAVWLAAIARIGAIAIPISTMIRANELVRVLRQSDVAGLFVQRTFLVHDLVERLCEALPGLRTADAERIRLEEAPYLRWIASDGPDLPGAVEPLAAFEASGGDIGEALLRAVEDQVHTTDQMIEIYTSGSMALPKGVRHNHGPVLLRAHFMRRMLGPERGRELPAVLPMFWVGGLMMSLLPNWTAGAVTLCTSRTLSNSRMAMGSVLAEDDLREMAERQPRPWWGLGMSETLGPYSFGDEFRAPGYPVCAPMDHFAEGYEIRVADEQGRPVGDGEVGEMQVRGPAVTPGLHKIERAEIFTPDGYLRTGDMCLVEGKRVHFVGRGGDMIKSAGSNVSPAEVEMELQSLEGVLAAYVVGLPDVARGQLVVAAVVPREGVTLDFAAIEAAMRQRLSPYKVPRGWIELTQAEVPLLHSNKVARREIAAIIARRLGRET